MATISKQKNGKYKGMFTKSELNTLTIAIGLLSFEDLENEAKEQGLDEDVVSRNQFEMFETLTKITKLYPKPEDGVITNEDMSSL